jgi:predicted amidophosphoribosyltransferase
MLTKIDELNLSDHWRLTPEDECYFVGDYTAGRGFSHSSTNQLILNLKKGLERRGLFEWQYKARAIAQAALALRSSLNPEFLAKATFVPIPPSRTVEDPLYDDRMTQVIRSLHPDVDARELVCQVETMHDSHTAENRPSPEDLYRNYRIESALVEPSPSAIAVVDDVLTTGSHFKAMKRILQETFDVPLVGIFVARRVPNTEFLV